MHWALQNNLYPEAGYVSLVESLERLGLPHSFHGVVPFVGSFDPPLVIDHTNVICMGSYSMRHAAAEMGWNPGVFDLYPFPFPVQHERWGDHMLNSGSRVVPIRQVVLDAPSFVRPIHDTKAFTAKVYSPEEFHAWKTAVDALGDMPDEAFDRNSHVQVSPPREIHAEYRFWIVKGRVVTSSLYKRGDTVTYSRDVPDLFTGFATEMVSAWQPHDAFVIDVADTPVGPKIVEINTLNASGFYAADVQRLVISLEDAFGL